MKKTQIDVSRYTNRKRQELAVEVLSPMFLGGSDGNAELRGAPFKAALRYWWRLTQGDIPCQELLRTEGRLFGGVHGNDTATKSLVDIVLQEKEKGIRIEKPQKTGKMLPHPEAERAGRKVPALGYLAGMGHFQSGCYSRTAIMPGGEFTLQIDYPSDDSDIELAIQLMARIGTIGARSRNAFGSFQVTGINFDKELPVQSLDSVMRHGENPYPHTLVEDDTGLLLWKITSPAGNDYVDVMTQLAEVYINLRTSPDFKFDGKKPGRRHLLGYPIMNHSLDEWGGKGGRLPSQLRLFMKKHENTLVGYIMHIAHPLPGNKRWFNELGSEIDVWKRAHAFLDGCNTLTRATLN